MTSINEVRLTGTLTDVRIEDTKGGKKLAKLTVETDPPSWMKNVTEKDRTQIIVFGKTVAEAEKLKAGQCVSILGRTRGREYNGRWYTDVIGEKFKVMGAAALPPVARAEQPPIDDSEVPF